MVTVAVNSSIVSIASYYCVDVKTYQISKVHPLLHFWEQTTQQTNTHFFIEKISHKRIIKGQLQPKKSRNYLNCLYTK